MSKPPYPPLWEDRALRPYLGEIARRHGIVETLALPSMRDLPPMRIETLFVPPLLAESAVSADSNPNNWPSGQGLFEALQASPQLVVLGDPGGGKTTLANWLAWRLAAGLTTPLPAVLENKVPVPCVLRDMPASLFTEKTSLPVLAEFIAKHLLGSRADADLIASLRARVAAGDYVLILDGVDEIPVPQRKVVSDWVFKAHMQKACVLATSRMVGYDDGPVDSELIGPSSLETLLGRDDETVSIAEFIRRFGVARLITAEDAPSQEESIAVKPTTLLSWAQRRYLMPFDQRRIEAFAENWYRQRLGSEQGARQKTADLLASLLKSPVTQQLARTPNLLSLMAIVHRERAHLPDGKALLYDEIANAYINTIDSQRKIAPGDALAPYRWQERKAWLAYVGFRMQERRSGQEEETQTGVLADEKDVLNWLIEAMSQSGVAQPVATAREYLGWVARRSGLLLPRGEGRYAFVHLSFQEYFCACYLNDRIVSPAYVRDSLPAAAPVSRAKLKIWGKSLAWRETLVYLFELLDADWVDDLADTLFGPAEDPSDLFGASASLAARAIADRHIRLGKARKDGLASRVAGQAWVDWIMRGSREPDVLQALLEAGYAALVSNTPPTPGEPALPLATAGEAAGNRELRVLIVEDERFDDLARFAGHNALRFLSLNNTQVADVSPLAGLAGLEWLYLGNAPMADVSPLAGLAGLRSLYLNRTPVSDVSPLAGLTNLRRLSLDNTAVADVSSLAHLPGLKIFINGKIISAADLNQSPPPKKRPASRRKPA
ncbi:MAG: NACHT domain-containing protein [Pseudomonadota bacterium]|nr:NACHT domain-containing protein [Pseudomonadota bacterium]